MKIKNVESGTKALDVSEERDAEIEKVIKDCGHLWTIGSITKGKMMQQIIDRLKPKNENELFKTFSYYNNIYNYIS